MESRYHIIKTFKEVKQLVKACLTTGYCCYDFETSGDPIYTKKFHPTILSITFQAGSGVSIPLNHYETKTYCEPGYNWKKVLKYVGRKLIENDDPKLTKIGWNLKFDNQIWLKFGIRPVGRMIDGMLAKYILNEERPNDLKSMVDRYLPEFGGYEKENGFDKLPWDKKPLIPLSKYGCMDTDCTFRLSIFFEQRLIDTGLYNLYRNLITTASVVFTEVEKNGLYVNKAFNEELLESYKSKLIEYKDKCLNLKKVKKFSRKQIETRVEEYISNIEEELENLDYNNPQDARKIKTREDKISQIRAGVFTTKKELALIEPLNLGSPNQLKSLLFSEQGFNLPILKYTDKKEPSTDEDTLKELRLTIKNPDNPKAIFLDNLLEYRGIQKMYTTFIEGWNEKLQDDSRLHGRYLIHGTTSGRASSQEPNLQQIPKTSVDPNIKKQLVAPKGTLYMALDYSQAELRIMAHLSKDETYLNAFAEGADPHLAVAAKKYKVPYDEALSIMESDDHPDRKIWKNRRKQAKQCFTGDTEILTENGWVRLDQYNYDKVAQYDINTGNIDFTSIIDYQRFRSGSIYKFQDKNIDLQLTGNHMCIFKSRNGIIHKKEALELNGKKGYMISAGKYHVISTLSEIDTRILALIASDGNINKSTLGLIRFGFTKIRKVKRFKWLLDQSSYKYTERVSPYKGKKKYSFYIKDFDLYKKVLRYMDINRNLRWKCIHELDGGIFLDEASYWDGTRNETRCVFSSSSKNNLDIMQAMGVLNNKRVKFLEPHVDNWKTHKTIHLISYKLDTRNTSRVNINFKHVHGNQFVYCVQVPKGNIVIRRNGKVSIQGNCVFGVIYGIQAKLLSQKLSDPKEGIIVTPQEAQAELDSFFKEHPNIKKYMKSQEKFLKKHGYVKSLFGRKRRLPQVYSDDGGEAAYAIRLSVNMPCQSAASDMTLFASILNYWDMRQGKFPYLPEVATVHDAVYYNPKPEDINVWTVYKIWDTCRNPSTKKYFGFQIDDISMSMDFTIGRSMAEELPFIPLYDYRKMLEPDFNVDEYMEEAKKYKHIPIKDFPKYFAKEIEECKQRFYSRRIV